MIYIPAALIGSLIGGLTAQKRGGKYADIFQYAVGYGIAFGLLGLILTIALDRTVL